MGQFLATGLIINCYTSKMELQKNNITKEVLFAEMQSKLYFDTSIFDLSEKDDYYIFTLKSDVLENQLIPFLQKYYPYFYNDSEYYDDVIAELKETPASEWLEYADGKPEEAFQTDKYGTSENLFIGKPEVRIKLGFKTILLSMEGKIAMECYGKHFRFFQYAIQQMFFEFSIAKAMRVYITG